MNDSLKNRSITINLTVIQLIGLRYGATHRAKRHRQQVLKSRLEEHRASHYAAAESWEQTIQFIDNVLKANLTEEEFIGLRL